MTPLDVVTYVLLFVTLYTEVYLLLAFLEGTGAEKPRASLKEAARIPKVAVFVPCYNEERTVAGTLDSLLALDYPTDHLEIIAINDGSKDGTQSILDTYASHPRITVLSKENGGKHSALNLALQHTDADIVGCLDADSFVTPHAVSHSVERFLTDERIAAVTPGIIVHNPRGLLGFIQQAEYTLSLFMRRAFALSSSVFITPGPLSLYRRDALLAIGGWRHAHGTEDMELALRLHEHGYGTHIANEPTALVITSTPKTIRALYKQRVRWTYGFIMNTMDYRHMLFNRAYGTLGLLVLPIALISIGSALYFTGLALYYALDAAFHALIRIQTIGLSFSLPSFELFYISTTMLSILVYLLITITLGLIFLGRSVAKSPMHPVSVPLYVALYSFLAPWWLLGAVVRALTKTQAPWR